MAGTDPVSSVSGSVVAIVKGGLGNQMFIYAAARALALRTGRRLYLDTRRGYLADGYGRSYRLDRFPIAAEEMPEDWRIAPTLRHWRHKLIRTANKCLPNDRRSYVAEKRARSPAQLTGLSPRPDRVTLHGYWQDEEYFVDHSESIRRELAVPEPSDGCNQEIARRMAATESAFLHVRRVLYSPLLERDYYQAAIDRLRAERPTVVFYLFGDDLEWPVKNLEFGVSEVVCIKGNPGDELADLWLMTRCRHAIMANSSFSWWGAWLGEAGADRLVFTPENPGVPVRPASGWLRVPNLLQSIPK